MRPPQRTPRSHAGELQVLYAQLYPHDAHAIAIDAAYRAQRSAGLAHCRVWLHRGACPYAVESTMAIVEAQQLDEQLLHLVPTDGDNDDGSSGGGAAYAVRSMYAIALVRFVNSLADAMQTGAYAQSIFRIAERINLPTHFVEVRHAATHEEMPTLDVLRQASVDALAWLQTNFWQPNLRRNASGAGPSEQSRQDDDEDDTSARASLQAIVEETANVLRPHVATYRRLAKQITRDASFRGPNKAAISAAQQRIVATVRRADVALQRQHHPRVEDADPDASFNAADILASILLEPGGMVPLSRHKRPRATKKERVATLPASLSTTWLPLLAYLFDALDAACEALIDGLVDCVTAISSSSSEQEQQQTQAQSQSQSQEDRSLVDTAASWLVFLLADGGGGLAANGRQVQSVPADSGLPSIDGDRQAASVVQRCLAQPSVTSVAVARVLCEGSTTLMDRMGHLLALVEPLDDGFVREQQQQQQAEEENDGRASGNPVADTATDGTAHAEMTDWERSIQAMERRLQGLDDAKEAPAAKRGAKSTIPFSTVRAGRYAEAELKAADEERAQRQAEVCAELPGWSFVAPSDETWRPSPLGMLSGGVLPDLTL